MLTYHWTESIHHDGSPRYVVGSKDYLSTRLTLKVRAGIDAPIEQMFLRTTPDGGEVVTPMHLASTDAACQWWEADLQCSMPCMNYRFILSTSEGVCWLTAAGILRYHPPDATDFRVLVSSDAPSWVRDSVFYEIFPDRFADGKPTNNVRSSEYLYYGLPVIARPWGSCPNPDIKEAVIEFFGGDLQGVVQRLDYLEELGVTALYLTPIFTSPSSHKYDTQDYLEVDPHIGGNTALAALRQALDARNMRLILDIVLNHCGATHPWFLTAQADPASPTAGFFTFRRYPDEYEFWYNFPTLPKLNYKNKFLREQMYAGRDSILRYWLRPPFRIDGWRIDAANMLARQGRVQLGHEVGRDIRRAVKEESPQAYLLGEHPYDGTPHLQGDELDASMNYQGFTFAIWNWLAAGEGSINKRTKPTASIAAQMRAFLCAVPWQIATQQFNLLGSHDTPRILTALNGDMDRVRVATVLLFTYPGVPCIFYGDEIGMEGGPDPDCRRCMPWHPDEWNGELRAWYQKLIQLRRTSPALRWGGFQLLYAAGGTIAFQRDAPEERILVVARRASDELAALPVGHAGLTNGVRLRELLTGTVVVVTKGMIPLTTLPDTGAQMWRVEG